MGIRKRVRRSIFALATIFVFACITSSLELSNLSNLSKKVVATGAENLRVSAEILNLVVHNSEIFYKYSVNKDIDQLILSSDKVIFSLDSISSVVASNSDIKLHYGDVIKNIGIYENGVRSFYSKDNKNLDNLYFIFQSEVYVPFVNSIKKQMLASQKHVVDETTKINEGISRLIMLGIVAILFMIAILMMFFVLLDTYYLKPVVKLTKSLNEYLVSKTPFTVKVDGRDEVYKLKELILDLISASKSANKGNNLFNKE